MPSLYSSDTHNTQPDLTEQALRWIVRLHSGAATAEDGIGFKRWRDISPAHEKAAGEAEALWADISELHVDPETGFVSPAPKRSSISRRTLLTGVLCLGGAAAVGTTIGTPDLFRRMSADYSTATARTRNVELDDGSRVYLNANSAINVVFDSRFRHVHLIEGQAFFEVARDADRPFEVIVDGVSVRALGTAFDVARNIPGIKAEVAVSVHAVRVTAISSFSGPYDSAIDVSQGERVTIDQAGRIGSLSKQDPASTAVWRDGVYVAEARPLSEVVAALSAWHHGMIIVSDEQLKTLKVNAVLDLRDPNGSLDTLKGGLPINVRHISSYLTIISGH